MVDSRRTSEIASLLSSLSPGRGLESIAEMPIEDLMTEAVGEPAPMEEEAVAARDAVRKLEHGAPLSDEDVFLIEAIIIPDKRPAVMVIDDDYTVKHADWRHFNTDETIRTNLRAAIPAIGRIELPDDPTVPYGGTGFVVGPDLVMTNRHVARLFASGVGINGLGFLPGQSADIDFEREQHRGGTNLHDIVGVVMVHPHWDMALLRVPGLEGRIPPLTLSTVDPEEVMGQEIAAIGFPAFDPRNPSDVQNQVFNGVYDVKRLQPGKIKPRERVRSFGRFVDSVTHDASTLGGNSGSAVLHVRRGTVSALHFAGRYRIANYAVPAYELSRDELVVAAGVNFGAKGDVNVQRPVPWQDAWDATSAENRGDRGNGFSLQNVRTGAQRGDAAGAATWTIPLDVTVSIGGVVAGASAAVATPSNTTSTRVATDDSLIERAVEPIYDRDYAGRPGYDQDFLGIRVPMPAIKLGAREKMAPLMDGSGYVVDYYNFSLVMHAKRRLAAITAANVDASRAAREPESGRAYNRRGLNGFTSRNDREKWFPDPRISAEHQLSDRFYNRDRQAFNKGHIVRRNAVAHGSTYREVQFANGDTFHITNCSPQVADFNQSRLDGLWGELENFIFDQAETEKLNVIAGPVLDSDDPFFVGVDDDGPIRLKIPRSFWKMVVARKDDDIQVFAFLLEQDLGDVDFGEFVVTPTWADHQVSVQALEDKLGFLVFDDALKARDMHGRF